MELLERSFELVGGFFNGVLRGFERGVTNMFGSSNARTVKRLAGRVEAINALEDEYKALILDLMMPHEGGMTVIRHLRENQPELLQRVIVLTATPEAVLRGIEGEVFAIVHKPFDPEHLVQTVASLP